MVILAAALTVIVAVAVQAQPDDASARGLAAAPGRSPSGTSSARKLARMAATSAAENVTYIRIAAETWQPYFLIGQGANGETVYSGIMWDLLQMLATKMNLRFEIYRPPDGMWGVELPNGSWNGMLGMIQRQEVDMALGPFAVSYQRTKVADFPASIFVLPHRLYLPRPRGSPDLSDFVRLFHPLVWLMVLLSVCVVSLAVWAASRMEAQSQHTLAVPLPAFKVLLQVWASLMQESCEWRGVGVGRALMGMWFLVTLVLMNTYSGLLVASLSFPKVAIPIASVEELVAQDKLPWRLEQGGIILHTFETADVKMYKTLLQGSKGFFPDCFAAREDIARGRFAGLCDVLAGDMMVAKTFSSTGRCDFYSPRQNIVTHTYTLVLQKNSPLKENVNFWLQELQERGWVDQLVNQRVNNGTICKLSPGQEVGQVPPSPLAIMQMWGVFAILAVGLGVGSFVFLLEKMANLLH
ncbi:glutamate receptor 4 [Penaeus vannamei]|uniref:glutamate receptor 4 n=1 Tax=Penaeus vannamei TaxID=6689 RepID=UPI00387F9E44